MTDSPALTVTSLLHSISTTGTDAQRGGYSRPVYSAAENDLRTWFVEQATRIGLDVHTDRNGLIWAWLDVPGGGRSDAVVTGSHLDSVPGGGAFDGPLGVASALVALQALRDRPRDRPIAIAVFPEEEGSRFGSACLGSRLITGELHPARALNLRDDDGLTFADVLTRQGLDPRHIGPDPEAVARIGHFVELHVEQGRGLIDLGRPVAVGSSILAHGRWKISLRGQGNHAGTTEMADRRDPMLAAAGLITDIRSLAAGTPDARATVGRISPVPGGTNVIASRVDVWLDVRHHEDAVVADLVRRIEQAAQRRAEDDGCTSELVEESFSPTAIFDPALTRRLEAALPDAPLLRTGAGHDAGVLAAHLPSAMLFVRNPSGISHSPEEHVEDDDAELGAVALTQVLADLATAR